MGAHPGGLYTGELPGRRATARTTTSGSRPAPRPARDDYDDVDPALGARRRDAGAVGGRSSVRSASRAARQGRRPTRGAPTTRAYAPDLDAPANAWERAAVWGARYLADRVEASGADAVLAGAGVANLSAWLGVQLARDARLRRAAHRGDRAVGLRRDARRPVRAEPSQLSDRDDARATRSTVLGALVGGPGTTTIGCLGGAQIDRIGNVNSTWIPPAPVPRRIGRRQRRREHRGRERRRRDADAAAHAGRVRLHHVAGRRRCARSSPISGRSRSAADELVLTAVPSGDRSLAGADRTRHARPAVGTSPSPSRVGELAPPERPRVAALRRWDPQGWFLRAR